MPKTKKGKKILKAMKKTYGKNRGERIFHASKKKGTIKGVDRQMRLRWNKQLIIDYQRTFNSEEGKRVLADMRKLCPFLTESINTTNGVDVNKLLIHEGRRSVLLHIYKMLHRDPNEEAPERAVNRGE